MRPKSRSHPHGSTLQQLWHTTPDAPWVSHVYREQAYPAAQAPFETWIALTQHGALNVIRCLDGHVVSEDNGAFS